MQKIYKECVKSYKIYVKKLWKAWKMYNWCEKIYKTYTNLHQEITKNTKV